MLGRGGRRACGGSVEGLGVVGCFSRAARIGQLSNANPSFSSHQSSRRLMPGVPTRSTAEPPPVLSTAPSLQPSPSALVRPVARLVPQQPSF